MLCVLCAIAVIISVYSVPSVATPEVYGSAQSAKPVDQDSKPVLARRDSLRVAHGSSASFFVCFWCVGEDRPGAHGVNSLSG